MIFKYRRLNPLKYYCLLVVGQVESSETQQEDIYIHWTLDPLDPRTLFLLQLKTDGQFCPRFHILLPIRTRHKFPVLDSLASGITCRHCSAPFFLEKTINQKTTVVEGFLGAGSLFHPAYRRQDIGAVQGFRARLVILGHDNPPRSEANLASSRARPPRWS